MMHKTADSLLKLDRSRKFRRESADTRGYFSTLLVRAFAFDDKLAVLQCQVVIVVRHLIRQLLAACDADIGNPARKFHAHKKRVAAILHRVNVAVAPFPFKLVHKAFPVKAFDWNGNFSDPAGISTQQRCSEWSQRQAINRRRKNHLFCWLSLEDTVFKTKDSLHSGQQQSYHNVIIDLLTENYLRSVKPDSNNHGNDRIENRVVHDIQRGASGSSEQRCLHGFFEPLLDAMWQRADHRLQ